MLVYLSIIELQNVLDFRLIVNIKYCKQYLQNV